MAEEELELEEQQQELYEHHHIIVDRGQEMLRIDKYLQMRLQGVSRTKVQAATKATRSLRDVLSGFQEGKSSA